MSLLFISCSLRRASSRLTPPLIRARVTIIRLVEWMALFGSLFGLEFAFHGAPRADDLLAYQVSALFSLLMFVFLPAWLLAPLLSALGAFIVWHSLTAADMTPGAAMVVIGIAPVLGFLASWLDDQQTSGRHRGPDWRKKSPFFDFCGRRR